MTERKPPSSPRAPASRAPGRTRGGLPDDDGSMQALSALASQALRPATRPVAAVPAMQPAAAPAQEDPAPQHLPPAPAVPQRPLAVAPERPVPSAPAAGSVDEPAAGSTQYFIKQATVQVDASVAQRFRLFRKSQDPEPSNAEVIFRALAAADGRYRQIIDARRPQLPPGRRFGGPVPGRKQPGTRLLTQINFRPTVGEDAEIKKLAQDSGADSMSAFINAVLDDYLPAARTRGART